MSHWMGRRVWAICLTALLCLSGLAGPLAQKTEAQGIHTPYDTTIEANISIFDRQLTASIYAPFTESPPEWLDQLSQPAVADALQAAAGCDLDEESIYLDETFSAWGRCEEISQVDLGWQGTVDLSPLLSLLSATPMTHLSVSMSMPTQGDYTLSPPGEPWLGDEIEFSWGGSGIMDHHRVYDIEIANPQVQKIQYRYEFTTGKIALDIAGIVSVCVGAAGLFVWLRQRALSAHAKAVASDETSPIWFSYQRCSAMAETGTWFAWFIALGISEISAWKSLFLPAGSATNVLGALAALLVPMLLSLFNRCLSYRVMRQVGKLEYTLPEVMAQFAANHVIIFCLVIGISSWSLLLSGELGYWLVMVVLVAVVLLCKRVKKKFRDWAPHAITTGELRDRVFEIAKPTGVSLNQLYLLPMKRSRSLNAFAVKNNTVMVTDYLLKRLNKAEVDGILAHEVAHLQLGHPKKLMWQLIGLGLVTLWISQSVFLFASFFHAEVIALQWPLAVLIIYLSFVSTSRKFEYQADAQGVLLTGNPQAAITGLVKLTRFNQMPMQWGKFSESMMTHPSLMRRISVIAKRYDLPDDEIEQLTQSAWQSTAEDLSESERYSLDMAELSSEEAPLFSTEQQQKLGMRLFWATSACFTLLPAFLCRVILLLPTPGLRWLGYIGAGLTVVGAYFYLNTVGATWGFGKLKKQLSARLQVKGYPASEGVYVGFSPEAELRVYESCLEWDIGFLFLVDDRICYVGERIQFAIAAEQITAIDVRSDSPSWGKMGAIALTWQDNHDSHKTYRFNPLDLTSTHQSLPTTRKLWADLDEWRRRRSGEPTERVPSYLQSLVLDVESKPQWNRLDEPELGTVTNRSLAPFTLRTVLSDWLIYSFVSVVTVSALASSIHNILFVLAVVSVGVSLKYGPALQRSFKGRNLSILTGN